MPSTQNSVYRAQKAQKGVFGLKNKKTQNNVRFLFYIYVIAEELTAYAKLGKTP